MKHVDMRKLPAAAQEERRRQVIGLRQAGLTYDAIAAQVGLSPTGVFDICQRFAERGPAGLKTGPRGPEPGRGWFLDAGQEREARDLIRRHTPDELDLPFALWSRAAFRGSAGGPDHGHLPGAPGLHRPEAAAAGPRAGPGGGAVLAQAGLTGDPGAGQGRLVPAAGYHLYYPSHRQPTAAFALLVDALRYRG
jgi:transposase